MPYIEMPADIAEELADKFGIYGTHNEQNPNDCKCRVCFVVGMTDRIRRAVDNEQRMDAGLIARKPKSDGEASE